ncbi:MAG: MFS transporter [Promethearchaeota archaeon]
MRSSATGGGDNRLLLAWVEFVANVAGYAYFAYLPLFMSNLGLSPSEVTFSMTWMTVGVIFSFLFGKASDRTGRRKPFVVAGLLLQVLVFAVLGLGTSVAFFSVVNLLRGFSLALRGPATNAYFSDVLEERNVRQLGDCPPQSTEIRGTQLSLLTTTTSAGWAIGAAASGVLVERFGGAGLSWFLLAFGLAAAVSSAFLRDAGWRLPPGGLEGGPDGNPASGTGAVGDVVTGGDGFQARNGRGAVNKLVYAGFFIRHFGLIVHLQILVVILADAGISPSVAGTIVALNPLGQVVGMVLVGRLVDHPRVSEKATMGVGYLLSAATLASYALGVSAKTAWPFVAGQLFLSFGYACIATGANKYISNRTTPVDRARHMGYRDAAFQGSKLVAYPAFAALWTTYAYAQVLPFAVAFPLAAAVLVVFL